ncbi:MAG: S41 family peptidase [Planctomycetota bacterium]
MPPRNFNVVFFAIVISLLCHVTYRKNRSASILGEAIDLIEKNYIADVDRDSLLTAAMKGMVGTLDEHTSYFEVDAYESFQDSMHQEFVGVGISVNQPSPDEPVKILSPLVGSPALRAGVLPNDRIVGIDGEDVSEMDLSDVIKRLKGLPNTEVVMTVRRGDEEISMSIARARIETESVFGDHRDENDRWVYRLEDEPSIAYIRVASFADRTVDELGDVLLDLNNDFSGLVLDLRGNGGGLLYAARDVCDMFLSSGDIVSTRDREGIVVDKFQATNRTLVDERIPVAILIDQNSASASEIVAAAIQDNERGIVVGMRSYGKGTVQEILPLEYGRRALRLTVARYFRPNNENIHRMPDDTEADTWGVTPNQGFAVPMTIDDMVALRIRHNRATYPRFDGLEIAFEPLATVTESDSEEEASPSQQTADEISAVAESNVQRGPESLAFDPPLRAAVGALLGSSTARDAEASSEMLVPAN